jgi:hypothetical protein
MFRPIWPSSGVKCFIVIGETAALVVAVVIYLPQMRTRMLWLLCLLSSADLAACPSLNAVID